MLLRAVVSVLLSCWLISPAIAQPAVLGEQTRALYENHCIDCHEADGRGNEYRSSGISIPDFSSKAWMEQQPVTRLKLNVLLGKGEEMPPFEGEITEDEAVALVQYIRAMAGLSIGTAVADSKVEFDRDLSQLQGEWDRLRTEWNRVFADFETMLARSPVRSPRLKDVK